MKKRSSLRAAWTLAWIGFLLLNSGALALAQEPQWSEPLAISNPGDWSWFPDLAVSVDGVVHAVWCWTRPAAEKGQLEEQVMYTRRQGDAWDEPNDIVPLSKDIVRNGLAADQAGNLHMVFGGSVYDTLALYYQRARADKAWSASAWSPPHRLNQGLSYIGDIAVDSHGVVHIVYDDTIYLGEGELPRADIYYRRSADGGATWSAPINLYPTPLTGSARPSIEIDSSDTIHVAWDEGWDRLSGTMADSFYSVYVSSADGGQTWTEPNLINYPDTSVADLTVGSDDKGGVMLVWRSMAQDQIFYQWSADGGRTWGEVSVIPQIFARSWSIPFDMYDMTTDSNGTIHLFMAGRESKDKQVLGGMYHLAWDGEHWSAPTLIFAQPGLYPYYPKATVHEGDQLHVVWFTKEGDEFKDDVNRVVWYSHTQLAAPHQPVTPQPTTTLEPVRQVAVTSSPAPSPTPLYQGERDLNPPQNVYNESSQVLQLALWLAPVVILIAVVAVIRASRSGRFM